MPGRPRALWTLGSCALLACQVPPPVPAGPLPPAPCEDAAETAYSVFLIGDAGAAALPPHAEAKLPVDPVLRQLRADVMEQVGMLGVDRVTVVYLGDNVFPAGLAPSGDPQRRRGERVLEMQIAAAGPARAIFLAGNRDWQGEGPRGFARVREQQLFLATQGERVSMLPPGGCAGPERVDFGEYLGFVFIDPIGFEHADAFPQAHAAICPREDALDASLALSKQFEAPGARHIVLALPYPLSSSVPHGQRFTWKQHLFPLTDFVPWLWLPLPVVGSLYPLSRQLGGSDTDLSSDAYQSLIRAIWRAVRPRVPLLFAAGHDHGLQLHRDGAGAYHAVSGAGSMRKGNGVVAQATASFSLAAPGYMRLDVTSDGALGVTVLALVDGEPRQPVLSQCLADGPAGS